MDMGTKDVMITAFDQGLWSTTKMASLARGKTLKSYVAEALREKLAKEDLEVLRRRGPRKVRNRTPKGTYVKEKPVVETIPEVPIEAVCSSQDEELGECAACGSAIVEWLGEEKCSGCGKVSS